MDTGWASEKFRFFGDVWLYGVGDDLESWGVDGARQKIWHGGEVTHLSLLSEVGRLEVFLLHGRRRSYIFS